MSAPVTLLSATARQLLANQTCPAPSDIRAALTAELAEYGILPVEPGQRDASRFLCGEHIVIAISSSDVHGPDSPHYGWSVTICKANGELGTRRAYWSFGMCQHEDLAADTAKAAFTVADHFTGPGWTDTAGR
ncbi:hypothetical protein [Streptomyces longispororuber]|uniref:hypothetical protein n=1 Tax=Streptomyces longispororuber TaxID=68230 RepID=UPI0036F83E44